MRIKFLPLLFLSLQAFGSAQMEIEWPVGPSHGAPVISEDLRDVCAKLVAKLGYTRAPAITCEKLEVLEVPQNAALWYFFQICNNLKWKNWDFVNVTRQALWTDISKYALLEQGLFPITQINDSNGYICFNTCTGLMEAFYPTHARACGTHVSSSTHHQTPAMETLAGYLQRYLLEIGA